MKKSFLFALMFMFLAAMFVGNIYAQEEEILDIVSGKITVIDLSANKLTIIDKESKTQEFALDPNLTTVWDDTADEEKELSDLTKDKDVVVEFRVDKDGGKLASWIDIIVVEEEPAEEAGT